MPRSTTKTSPSEVEKRDASPKRKLPRNVMSLWFDEFLKKNPSINPEILITKLIDSTPVQANFLARKWRSDLWDFFAKHKSTELLKDFLCGRCLTCDEGSILELDSADFNKSSFVDSDVVPVSGTAFNDKDNREYFWNMSCSTKCLAAHPLYDGHYFTTKTDAPVNYYSSRCSSDMFTGDSVTIEAQNKNIHRMQKDLNLTLKIADGQLGGLIFVSGFDMRFFAWQDRDGDYCPVVAICSDFDKAGGLYFSRRRGFSPLIDNPVTAPPFDCVGGVTLAELTWLAAFGAPKELDEDDLYEDEWVDPFFDEEDPSSSSDEEEQSGNEES